MPLVVAVLAFVVQLNGLKVKIDDLAKDAQVSLTIKNYQRSLLRLLMWRVCLGRKMLLSRML